MKKFNCTLNLLKAVFILLPVIILFKDCNNYSKTFGIGFAFLCVSIEISFTKQINKL